MNVLEVYEISYFEDNRNMIYHRLNRYIECKETQFYIESLSENMNTININNNNDTYARSFEDLIQNLGTAISNKHLIAVKKSLLGHIDKDGIDRIRNGNGLISTLLQKKLVNKNKLAFLRKLFTDVANSEELLNIIDTYKQSQAPPANVKHKIVSTVKQDSLRIIEDRQLMTLDEYKSNLEKITFDHNNLKSAKQKLKDNIKSYKTNIAALKVTKGEDEKKLEKVKKQITEKENVLMEEKKNLSQVQEELKRMEQFIEESTLKIKQKGKSRLNAFQRSLEKEELKNAEKDKVEQLLKLGEQQTLIESVENEMQMISNKENIRRNNIRTKGREMVDLSKKLCDFYISLRQLNDELLTTTDEIYSLKISMFIVEEELNTPRKEFSQESASTKEDAVESINAKLLSEERKSIEYALFGSRILTIGSLGKITDPIKFNHPVAIVTDQNGNILVADEGNKRLVLMTIFGKVLVVIDLDTLIPNDVTVDKDNRFIVVGKSAIRIYKEKIFVKQFLPHYEPGRMRLPSIVSIAYNRFNDLLYILDEVNLAIQVFDTNGAYQHTKEIFESLTSPTKMKIISERSLVIVDDFENCYKIYTFHTGTLYSYDYFGSYGVAAGELVKPCGITLDSDGNFVICDAGNHRVQVFDSIGDVIAVRGRLGESLKCFHHPIDVTFHSAGLIFIADYENHRIMTYC